MMPWERAFPLWATLRSYTKEQWMGDMTAGLTTAVLLIPQGMAYAMLAGLPPIVGLYSALVPPVLYALLGTSRQLSVGPVALDSLLVAVGVGAIAQSGTPEYLGAAVLLALMVGLLQLLMGALRMGFLANFLSQPVISGFSSAAAVIIGLSQMQHFLGVKIQNTQSVFVLGTQVFSKLLLIQKETFFMGLAAFGALLVLKKKVPKFPAALAAVTIGALLVFSLDLEGRVAVVGTVPAGLPSFSLPIMNLGLLSALFPPALTIAFVGFVESISVSRTYARKNKYSIVPNRELIALGAANFLGSFFQTYPVAGGLSRTAVSAAAGAMTGVSSLISSALIAISLLFLTPLFYFLPKAVLAAIILTAVLGLLDFKEVKRLYRINRSELALLSGTFVATLLLGIVQGIAFGVLASLLWFVVRTTRPHIAVLGRVPGTTLFRNIRRNEGLTTYENVIALRMDAQFYFGNVAFLRNTLIELEQEMKEDLNAVILDASAMNALDSSGESALREMGEAYQARGVQLFLTGVKGPVRDVIESSGFAEILGKRALCLTVHEAISILGAAPRSMAHAPSSGASDPGGANASANL